MCYIIVIIGFGKGIRITKKKPERAFAEYESKSGINYWDFSKNPTLFEYYEDAYNIKRKVDRWFKFYSWDNMETRILTIKFDNYYNRMME